MHNRYTKREIMAGYCFILPAAVFLALIVIYPLIYNLSMSFHEVTLETFRGEQPFIGLENYREVLAMPMVRKSIWNTVYFTVMSIMFQFVIGFALARHCICLCMEMDICRGWFRYLKLFPDPAAYCEGAGFLADHGTGGHDSSYHYEYLERRSL